MLQALQRPGCQCTDNQPTSFSCARTPGARKLAQSFGLSPEQSWARDIPVLNPQVPSTPAHAVQQVAVPGALFSRGVRLIT